MTLLPVAGPWVRVCAWVVVTSLPVAAQVGASAGAAAGATTSAVQLPLSGRTAQGGSVISVQSPVPGTTTSVNTLNATIQVQGPYQGSVAARAPDAGPVSLSLREAIRRGLEYNLGPVQLANALRQARGQRRTSRSSLLPNVTATLQETVQQTSLVAVGIRFPGSPSVVGPFNYFDARARLTQTLFDLTTMNNYRSSQELEKATEFLVADARDLVVQAVSGTYLQAVAAAARVESARAQVETAQALLQQSRERNEVGLTARIDVNRAQVELQTQQQRLASLENDVAKQRLTLARLIGLAPGQAMTLTDGAPYAPVPALTLDAALARASEHRADLRAAEAQVRAAERTRNAARSERLPSLAVNADYGVIGPNPGRANGTFAVTGSLRIPLYQGGRTEGNVEQAEAALAQRRAELADVRGRIDLEIRSALLDLGTATSQVTVAENNRQVTRDTLTFARQRFEAGIADSVEVTRTQQDVAAAEQDYITSLTAYNIAKVSLSRALGRAEESVAQLLGLP